MSKTSKSRRNKLEQAPDAMEEGKLKMGRSNKRATDYRQTIAIGLAEARKEETRFRNKY